MCWHKDPSRTVSMLVLKIILWAVAYIAIATVVFWVTTRVTGCKTGNKSYDYLWLAFFWPFTLPFLVLWVVVMCVLFSIRWIADQFDKLIGKKDNTFIG